MNCSYEEGTNMKINKIADLKIAPRLLIITNTSIRWKFQVSSKYLKLCTNHLCGCDRFTTPTRSPVLSIWSAGIFSFRQSGRTGWTSLHVRKRRENLTLSLPFVYNW